MSELTRVTELDGAWATRSAGARLDAVRKASRKLRERILATGTVRCVRTTDVATFPYPTAFGLQGVAKSPAPYVFMRNRVQLVQTTSGGRTITILVNPTDSERSAAAPFFAKLEERAGKTVSKLLSAFHSSIPAALAAWGVSPADVDYITYDHLHVQDVRGLLAPGPSGTAFLPNAKLLVQKGELDTLANLHPLQAYWYIPAALAGIPADRIVELDGDYLVGDGFALLRTPGHTAGNHSPVIVTDRGAWTISENGICIDAYAPGISEIRGIARHARDAGVEVILNANTREATLDQYTSMVLEKTIASSVPDRPELPQCFPSSELVAHPLAPGLRPTYSHGAIRFGELAASVTHRVPRTANLA